MSTQSKITLPVTACILLALGLSLAGSRGSAQEPQDGPREPQPRSEGEHNKQRPDERTGEPRGKDQGRPAPEGGRERGRPGGPQPYSLEQAVSDEAQLHTIASDGLAFITGDFGAATFIPPGKVCDFFGFQYMRDIDTAEKGHNPIFLDRVAGNVLKTLTDDQRRALASLAREQAGEFDDLARSRWPLIKALGNDPAGHPTEANVGLTGPGI